MKKRKSKAEKSSKYNSITTLVLSLFKSTPKIKSKEMIEIVKDHFPKSKFNVYHYSWYKYQIKKGRYTKHFEKGQLRKIFKSTEN